MNKPKISVIMPVYNGQKYIREAIDSILNQTFFDYEFIIINDGSSDSTAKIISSYSDPRIIVITHPKNLGIVKSLNEGITNSKGDYIVRMDADDISVTDRVEKQYRYMFENTDVVVCASNIKSIDQEGKVISSEWWTKETASIEWSLIWGNVIPHPTVMLKKSALPKNRYRNYLFAEDYDLWLRMMNNGRIVRLDDVLVYYRQHNDHINNSTISMDEAYRSNLDWISNTLKLSPPIEHRWLSKFSQYGEDFGDISFIKALVWIKEVTAKVDRSAHNMTMLKLVLEACDKLTLKRKISLLHNTLQAGYLGYVILIVMQTIKQYLKMILGIK